MPNDEIFVPPCPLHTPILFMIYRRPDTTRQVFEAIRKAKPAKLYVAADGPKLHLSGERDKVQQTREIVLKGVDWECEVKTLFQESNLGCKYGVSTAINWFFENEEMGIILEDDTLPRQSFFWFCQELLNVYKDEARLGMVSGHNRFENPNKRSDFFFSKHGFIWGWASWRRAWKNIDIEMNSYNNKTRSEIKEAINNKLVYNFWIKKFDQVAYSSFDTWDFQWTFTRYLNNYLTARPKVNMVKNIGFDKDATHTKGNPEQKFLFSTDLYFPLKYPKEVNPSRVEDIKIELVWLFNFFKRKLKLYMKKQ
ncbi:MAG: hypothetical protein U5L07_11045 [Desulfobacterales bacterium]|nr:hypothetical protein [Desulfobacterales bacterium]